ncbi:MAG: porin [Rhodobiaceae bacterium]|nr:porin [Rhodobiaceae bacterium]
MNKFKSLLLGTAAAAIAATGAQAADAPMGREPVYRCDITGFIELPGTDICFKVGGFARLVTWAQNSDATLVAGGDGDIEGTTGTDEIGMYAQGRLNFDARRSTDHGTVRAFIEMQATDGNTNSSGSFLLRHAFAQLGNWVFGKTWSTYLHGASDPNGSDWSPVAHTIRINQIRYTHSVGNGVTVSVALEDQAYEQSTAGVTTSAGGGLSTLPASGFNGGFGDNDVPSVVANINYANAGWDVQLSGVAKFNEFSAAAGGSDTGYGIMLGVAAELTDSLNAILKVNYTEAAPSYQFDWFTGGTNTGDDHEQFGIMGGIAGSFNDKTTWQLAGIWGDSDNTGSTGIAATGIVDREIYGAQAVVQYRAASGFDFLAEVLWRHTDYNATDKFITGANAGNPNDTDEVIGGITARASF